MKLPSSLGQQGAQQVHTLDLRVSSPPGFGLGRLKGFGGLHGQPVDVQHVFSASSDDRPADLTAIILAPVRSCARLT